MNEISIQNINQLEITENIIFMECDVIDVIEYWLDCPNELTKVPSLLLDNDVDYSDCNMYNL